MMAVTVETEPAFSAGNPAVLFTAPYLVSDPSLGRTRTWDVAQDRRFLMVKEGHSAEDVGVGPNIVVVENWFQGLKRLVPVN